MRRRRQRVLGATLLCFVKAGEAGEALISPCLLLLIQAGACRLSIVSLFHEFIRNARNAGPRTGRGFVHGISHFIGFGTFAFVSF